MDIGLQSTEYEGDGSPGGTLYELVLILAIPEMYLRLSINIYIHVPLKILSSYLQMYILQ